MHTSQTTHPLTKLHYNFVCFDAYRFWLPSNLEILSKIYKSVSTPKTYRYTVALWTECAMVPVFVLALCYSSWGSELLSPLT